MFNRSCERLLAPPGKRAGLLASVLFLFVSLTLTAQAVLTVSSGAISSDGNLSLTVATTSVISLQGGNIGIGTTTPPYPLTVVGNAQITSHSAFGNAATIDDQPFSGYDPSSQTAILNARETNIDNSKTYNTGLIVEENLNPSAPLGADYHAGFGIEGQIITDPTNTRDYGDLYGIESVVSTHGTGSVDNQWGYSGGRQIVGGPVGTSYGLDVWLSPVAQTLDSNYGINIETPNVTTGSIGTNYGLSIQDQQVGTNNYAIWYDGPGNVVWRVRADGVVADYNPSFSPKYMPGATDFERVVTQWNNNVAQIGTENEGTGAARALAFITASTTRMTISATGNVSISTTTFSSIGTCNAGAEGSMRPITDSAISTLGATISVGGSSNHVLAYCDGTNWTVMAK